MVTERDEVIKAIRRNVGRDWKINGMQRELPPQATVILENGIVQVDPRFTAHC